MAHHLKDRMHGQKRSADELYGSIKSQKEDVQGGGYLGYCSVLAKMVEQSEWVICGDIKSRNGSFLVNGRFQDVLMLECWTGL